MDMDMGTSMESTVSSAASKGMGGGATVSLFGWMTSEESIAVLGLSITILGFIVNLIFKIRQDKREQELQKAKLAALHEHPEA